MAAPPGLQRPGESIILRTMDEQLATINQAQTAAIDLAFKFGPKMLVAIVILIAGVLVGRWAAGVAGRMFEKLNLDIAPQPDMLQSIIGDDDIATLL